MESDLRASILMRLHSSLHSHFGDPGWWPGETSMEIAVGAVLTQNTSWSNVERAIDNLSGSNLLSPTSLSEVSTDRLSDLIRPAGYFNQKSGYLKNLANFILMELEGDIEKLSEIDLPVARSMLLGVKGIGKETADSILCYSAGREVLVVDAYTFRILGRYLGRELHRRGPDGGYDDLASSLMDTIQGDNILYNRFHALIVMLGKDICKKKPLCNICPVRGSCSFAGSLSSEGNGRGRSVSRPKKYKTITPSR